MDSGIMRKSFIQALALIAVLIGSTVANAAAPHSKYSDGLLGKTTPKGWIKEFLDRQCSGLSGHPEAMSYPYNTNLWNGTIERMSTHGRGWWRYEQSAYYSDGLIRLGYALDKQEFIDKIVAGINYTIEHATPEGMLGDTCIHSEKFNSMWPMAVFFRAMKAKYDESPDPRIPAALEKYYLCHKPTLISRGRNIVSLEGMLWTYGKTGNKDLLRLAEESYALGGFELYPESADMDGCPHLHGVTYCEEMKLPALLYMYTGKEEYRRIALAFEDKLVHYNMLPSGVPSSAEYVLGNSIENAHETCDIADFTWADGFFLEMTGDGKYADQIEKAVFNALPGAITKDFKAIQYFSNMNQFTATGESNPNPYMKGRTWQAYRPVHETECCVGNVHRVMPNYVSRMWLSDRNGGLVAALYGPGEIEFGGLRVEEITNYPFEEDVKFVFHTSKPFNKSFSFRIPAWCKKANITINGKAVSPKVGTGGFVTLKRSFREGDTVEIHFDMPVRLTHPAGQGISYERGPLLFSYSIPTTWTVDETEYKRMRGKKCENPDFKNWNLTPCGDFNYAVDQFTFELVKKEVEKDSYPYERPPFSIRIPVRQIKWGLVKGMYTPPIPPINVKKLTKEEQYIELVPYGCTQLRLTVFPKIGNRTLVEGLF